MKVEVAVLDSPSLTVRMVSVDVKQHGTQLQYNNLRVPSLQQYTPVLLFTFALLMSNITHASDGQAKSFSKLQNVV